MTQAVNTNWRNQAKRQCEQQAELCAVDFDLQGGRTEVGNQHQVAQHPSACAPSDLYIICPDVARLRSDVLPAADINTASEFFV